MGKNFPSRHGRQSSSFGKKVNRRAAGPENEPNGVAVSAYRVHAYTTLGTRVETVEVRAKSVEKARDKARAVLYRLGRQPNRLTLVPVQVNA
jgi:hypothetical protein